MAKKTLDDAAFWNGLLMAKSDGLDTDFGLVDFPSEFPYEVDSPVESVLSSTETNDSCDYEAEEEQHEAEEEEEDFLAELTRRLTRSSAPEPLKTAAPRSKPEKLWAVSGSPKSTLNGLSGWPPSQGGGNSRNGSPTGGSTDTSPPTTPFVADNAQPSWDLIYAAAGQVARLRLTGEGAKLQPRQQPIGAPVWPSKSHSTVSLAKAPHSGFCSGHVLPSGLHQSNQYQNVREEQMLKSCYPEWARSVKASQQNQQTQNRIRGVGYGGARPLRLPQSGWPSLQARNPQQTLKGPNLSSLLPNSSSGGVKRECTGTGVFLPRRYENPAPEPRRKSGCSTVLLPAKVVQALNLNLEDMNARSQQRFMSDCDVLMARRNALVAQQQKRNLCLDGGVTHEVRLPQEWTY